MRAISISFCKTLVVGLMIAGNVLNADTLLNWHLRRSGGDFALHGAAFGNGKYIAIGYVDVTANVMLTSEDGVQWTAQTPPAPTNYLKHIAFGNNVFVMASTLQNWRSINGTDWTPVDNGSGSSMGASLRLRFLNGAFWELRGSSGIRRSSDGITWNIVQPNGYGTNRYSDIVSGAGKLVVAGRDIKNNKILLAYSSNNGANWNFVPSAIDNNLRSVAYGNGRFVAVGGDGSPHGIIMTSSDGVNWSVLTETFEFILYSVIYDGGLFVIGGDAGTVLVSSNGLNWTKQWGDNNQVTGRIIYEVCRGQGKYLGVGARGTIIQSDPAGALRSPVPAIRANDTAGAIAVKRGDHVAVTVTMDTGDYDRCAVDWWVMAIPASGSQHWLYLSANGLWELFPASDLAACRPIYSGPLMNIVAPHAILATRQLPIGAYTFCFAIDPMDGILNYPHGPILLDAVRVTVHE